MLSAYVLKDGVSCKVYAWEKKIYHEDKGFYLCKYGEPVFLREPLKKISHFVHYSGSDKNHEHKEETEDHKRMKKALYNYFSNDKFSNLVLSVDIEHYILINDNIYYEADVYVKMRNGKSIAFECQISNIPIYKVEKKCEEYNAVGVTCVYVYPRIYKNKSSLYPYLVLINKNEKYDYDYYIPELRSYYYHNIDIKSLFDVIFLISNKDRLLQKIICKNEENNDETTTVNFINQIAEANKSKKKNININSIDQIAGYDKRNGKKNNRKEKVVMYLTSIGHTVEGYPCFKCSDGKIKFKTPEGYELDLSMSKSNYILK